MKNHIINEAFLRKGPVVSTQGKVATEIVENVPILQNKQSVSSGFRNLHLDFKIWAKYDDNQLVTIVFDGEDLHDLKKSIKKLLPGLDNVALDRITLRKFYK
ncbi:3703_t:CDS:2 [Gigaspora margarita]|uniref:3703_t:CDS:1 n=1 Tax=Gigaspora margarita TaxID=4874 RepID=A0ABN7W0H4_GIGMA|nr:3703_t:CDS:2 [Gigaspora margarita]